MTAIWRSRLTLALPLAGIALLAVWSPSDDGPTFCPFALVTGHACPGCGLTRALAHLIRGDLSTSIEYHPLAPVLAALALAGWIWAMLRRSGRVRPLPVPMFNGVALAFAAGLVVVWLGRALTGTLPPV